MSEPLLDRERLREAFDLLAVKLARRGVVGALHDFGGADGPMLDAAREVADELGLPRSWLNNQASSYVSGRAGRGTPVYDHLNLRVLTTPPEHLLAMKVRAARAVRDADDIRRLLESLDIHTIGDSSPGSPTNLES